MTKNSYCGEMRPETAPSWLKRTTSRRPGMDFSDAMFWESWAGLTCAGCRCAGRRSARRVNAHRETGKSPFGLCFLHHGIEMRQDLVHGHGVHLAPAVVAFFDQLLQITSGHL